MPFTTFHVRLLGIAQSHAVGLAKQRAPGLEALDHLRPVVSLVVTPSWKISQ
jgi:hypothetical protein